jgi:drug/metabolite transporter (DMT)-like permease
MNKTKGILITVLSAATFGFAFTLAPMTYGSGGSNPITLTFLRNFLCLPMFIILLKLQKTPITVNKKVLGRMLFLGCFVTTTSLTYNLALSMIDVGMVTTLHYVYPALVMLVCVVIYKEKLTLRKGAALLCVTLGVACFLLGAGVGGGGLVVKGMCFALLSGVSHTCYMIFIDRTGLKNEPPLRIALYSGLSASLVAAVFGCISGSFTFATITTRAWLLTIAFALLCNAIALPAFQLGIKYIGPTMAAILSTVEPITGNLFGVLLLGERMTPVEIISCLLILSGVVILSLPKNERNPDVEEAISN